MTGLTLSGNQLIVSICILGLIVLLAIMLLKMVLKYKLFYTKSSNYSIRSRVKASGADVLQLRSSILKFGFLVALSFVFFAFSWTVKRTPIENYKIEDLSTEALEITPPRIKIIQDIPVLNEVEKPKNPIIIADEIIETPKFIKPRILIPEFDTPNHEGESNTVVINTTPAPLPPVIEDDAPPIIIAEQMPRFPGCETIEGSNKDKSDCANKKLLAYIYKNINYPKLAKENGIEGTVVVRFTVNKKGEIVDIKLMRDPGAGLGASAINLIQSMNNLDALWTPGKQQGRPVSVLYTLPIRFKLK